jgi:thiamine-phosphate pyrophosphorylase
MAIGKSLAEPDLVPECRRIMETLAAKGGTLPLPRDVVVARAFKADAPPRTCRADDVQPDEMILDIGPQTAGRLAAPLQAICAAHDVAFIVNDSVSLAKRLKADGVHLGQDDGSPREAREELGREAQIGVTCHASRHMAMDAGEAGADYVAFGAFYPSTTKDKGPDAEVPDLKLLEWWSQIFEIPCVAIGGITPDNCAPLILAGADFLAVSGAVWGGDEVAAVEAFAEAMKAASTERKRILASRR